MAREPNSDDGGFQLESGAWVCECPDCGELMDWCHCCEMYTQNCCVEYGTCACS
jgi:hypothetical protein